MNLFIFFLPLKTRSSQGPENHGFHLSLYLFHHSACACQTGTFHLNDIVLCSLFYSKDFEQDQILALNYQDFCFSTNFGFLTYQFNIVVVWKSLSICSTLPNTFSMCSLRLSQSWTLPPHSSSCTSHFLFSNCSYSDVVNVKNLSLMWSPLFCFMKKAQTENLLEIYGLRNSLCPFSFGCFRALL